MITAYIISRLQKLATLSPYREICGIVASDGSWYSVTNIAFGSSSFVMSKMEYYRVLNLLKEKDLNVVAIFHSHPEDPTPSAADIDFVKRSRIDSLIVTPTDYRYIDAKKYI